eukprot:2366231-Pleurochrysis_carterae.AAC.1
MSNNEVPIHLMTLQSLAVHSALGVARDAVDPICFRKVAEPGLHSDGTAETASHCATAPAPPPPSSLQKRKDARPPPQNLPSFDPIEQ